MLIVETQPLCWICMQMELISMLQLIDFVVAAAEAVASPLTIQE